MRNSKAVPLTGGLIGFPFLDCFILNAGGIKQKSCKSAIVRPYLLNTNLVPECFEDIYRLQLILRQSNSSVDLSAVVNSRKAHSRNSGVLIDKPFQLKTSYAAAYESHKLTGAAKASDNTANLLEELAPNGLVLLKSYLL